jgi:Fic family protein
MELREAFRARLQRKAKALELVDHLFINPFITIQQAAKLLSTTRETARQTINVLAESDILEEISGRTWGRLYLARPIFDAIQGPARQ